MPDEVKLSTFPETEYEALALLYVQSRDISEASPEEIYDLYYDAKIQMRDRGRQRRKERKLT